MIKHFFYIKPFEQSFRVHRSMNKDIILFVVKFKTKLKFYFFKTFNPKFSL